MNSERFQAMVALWLLALLSMLSVGVASGCANWVPALPLAETQPLRPGESLVFGRVVVALTGPFSRIYAPEVRFFELLNRSRGERFAVSVESEDGVFAVTLPVGLYELARVQIREGPFLSMADLNATFQVGPDPILYVGTWRFGVESPRYGRMVLVSLVREQDDQGKTEQEILARYPSLAGLPIASLLPAPASSESRLYEVMPYPRYPRYFRRHWW